MHTTFFHKYKYILKKEISFFLKQLNSKVSQDLNKMPKQIADIKKFLVYAKRKDARGNF